MRYIESNLMDGERLVGIAQMHWIVFVPPLILALVVFSTDTLDVIIIPLVWIVLVSIPINPMYPNIEIIKYGK